MNAVRLVVVATVALHVVSAGAEAPLGGSPPAPARPSLAHPAKGHPMRTSFVSYFLRTFQFPEGKSAGSVLIQDMRYAGGWAWVDFAPCYIGSGEVDDAAVNDCAEGGTSLYRYDGRMWLQAALPHAECLGDEFSLEGLAPQCVKGIRAMYPGVPAVLLPRAKPAPSTEAAASTEAAPASMDGVAMTSGAPSTEGAPAQPPLATEAVATDVSPAEAPDPPH